MLGRKGFIIHVLVTFILCSLVLSCGKGEEDLNESKTVFKIGLPVPLSGGAAIYGKFLFEGATIAVEEINSSGTLKNIKLELVVEDGECSPQKTALATEKLIERDQVDVMTGAFCSSATLAITEVVKKHGIPTIIGLSSADIITQKGNPFVVRSSASNSQIMAVLSKYIGEELSPKPKTAAYLFEQTDFGRNQADILRNSLENYGIKTLSYDGVVQHETVFLGVITKYKKLKPDLVFLSILVDSAIPFLRQSQEKGFHSQWVNAISLASPLFFEKIKDIPTADGFISTSHFEATASRPEGKAFVDSYQKKFGKLPTHYAALEYDAIHIIASAINRAGQDLTRDKFLKALRSTKDFKGLCGTVTFDKNGQSDIGSIIFQWKDGKRVILKDIEG